jgi:hypothetical protein
MGPSLYASQATYLGAASPGTASSTFQISWAGNTILEHHQDRTKYPDMALSTYASEPSGPLRSGPLLVYQRQSLYDSRSVILESMVI